MSTILVVRKGKSIAIGADTLSKHGYTKQGADVIENSSKIIKVGRTYMGFTGEASWGLVMSHYMSRFKRLPKLDSPQSIFDFALKAHVKLKDDYFLNPKEDDKDEFESTRIDCMIANPAGIFGLYSLRSVDEYKRFYSFGSGSSYAVGAMHAVYDTHSVRDIALAGLEAAAAWDDATGGPFEVHVFKQKAS